MTTTTYARRPATTTDTRPASDRQISYLADLLAQRPNSTMTRVYRDWEAGHIGERITMDAARYLITQLLNEPREVQTRPAAPATPAIPATQAQLGYYVTADESVFVVVASKSYPDRVYAKKLVIVAHGKARWQYAPGMANHLSTSQPLDVEEAGRLSHKHGVCIICTIPLTAVKSVDRGIGPVCIKKLGR